LDLRALSVELRESIALRTDTGLHFGEVRHFERGRMDVECDGFFDLRTQVEFQFKLPGFGATVYGVARVLRAISISARMKRYTLSVLRMRRNDRLLLQQWIEYSARGETTVQRGYREEYDPGTESNPWGIKTLDSNVRTEGGRAAVRQALRSRFGATDTNPTISKGPGRRLGSGRSPLRGRR